jgi:hypothetical protein
MGTCINIFDCDLKTNLFSATGYRVAFRHFVFFYKITLEKILILFSIQRQQDFYYAQTYDVPIELACERLSKKKKF